MSSPGVCREDKKNLAFVRRVIPDARETEAVAFLSPEMVPLFDASERALMAAWNRQAPTVMILLPWCSAPLDRMRNDGLVHSFLCTPSIWDEFSVLQPHAPPENLCFELLASILNEKLTVKKLLVRQLPCDSDEGPRSRCPDPAALIMAHRGSVAHLRTALEFLALENDRQFRVRVGLDSTDVHEYRSLALRYGQVEFFQTRPSPAGPYVIRQRLAEYSSEPLLFFHDSDDVSCSDRFEWLRAELAAGCDLAGCHEIRVDEISKEVWALRFPLDVNKALDSGPSHAMLHPTSIIKRDAFFKIGGFSTNRIISADTQFLLRAYFHVKIRNVDRFLYIRRRHSAGLTVQPETAIGAPLRRRIEGPWSLDFEKVRNGQMELEKSTLRPETSKTAHEITRFTAEEHGPD